MKIQSCRTLLEVRVGTFHLAEIELHLRRADIAWFNNDDDEIEENDDTDLTTSTKANDATENVKQGAKKRNRNRNNPQNHKQQRDGSVVGAATTNNKWTELYHLLQHKILPRMFFDEIEISHHHQTASQRPPVNLGLHGIAEHVGEKNTNTNGVAATATTASTNASKRPADTKTGKISNNKRSKTSGGKRQMTRKQMEKLQKQQQAEMERELKLAEKNVFYAFGTTLQVAYRLQDLNAASSSATLLVLPNLDTHKEPADDSKNKKTTKAAKSKKGSIAKNEDSTTVTTTTSPPPQFQELIKLSKRIVLWCFPFDPANPTEADPPDGGFDRPEMIPLSQLFRSIS